MDGLIESAKQRLWDIVNELGRAQPQPELRLAILSYGNPEYGIQSGFVRVDLPFTSDLDAVSKTLFEFTTNGGDEYVARVVQTAVNDLSWSSEPDALRVIFVAGNEGAHQDPQLPVLLATEAAIRNGITVNTIYCGNESDGDATGWRQVATSTNGIFASINQDAAAVANIATPMDQELADLNKELNDTYVAFGQEGVAARENQIEQDNLVANMSAPAMASRAASKASPFYRSESWDLVDAVESGKALEEVAVKDLPAVMQEMEAEQRAAYVEEKADQRAVVQGRIQALAGERQDYIKKERAKLADTDEKGLDEVIQEGLRTLAEDKGFTFAESR
jgi:predicted Zn-dependent protease